MGRSIKTNETKNRNCILFYQIHKGAEIYVCNISNFQNYYPETHNMTDIILVEKATQKWTIIDIVDASDFNEVRTEDWNVEKYQDLAFEAK